MEFKRPELSDSFGEWANGELKNRIHITAVFDPKDMPVIVDQVISSGISTSKEQ
jgi:hypothetical protein